MDITDYHTDPDGAIDVAADANVKLLVLTHMVSFPAYIQSFTQLKPNRCHRDVMRCFEE